MAYLDDFHNVDVRKMACYTVPMKISFCTTCMGRAHHLKETLPQNIRDNPATEDMDVEFVVLNYNSQDDLHEWMTTDPEMKAHIESGLVRYGKTTDPEFFHMSHAKNMAHRMATGDVLCNLDADNFLGNRFAELLHQNFSENMDIVINPSVRASRLLGKEEQGFFGRVVISKDNFMTLGGYDETFSGWGGEDTDFLQRAKGLGLDHLRIDSMKYLGIIKHSNEDRVGNMVPAEDVAAELEKVETIKYEHHSAFNKLFNKLKILANPIQANDGTEFGRGLICMENDQDLQLDKAVNEILSPFNVCALGLPELVRGRLSPRIAEELNQSLPGTDFGRPASEL